MDLSRYPYIGYDTETTGLRYPKDLAFCAAIAAPDGKTWYFDFREGYEAKHELAAQLADYEGTIICHNASFDYRMTHAAGIDMPTGALDDTSIRACCLDEHLPSYGLEQLCQRYLGEGKTENVYEELAAHFGGVATRKAQIGNLYRAPADIVRPYVKQDALLSLRLWEWQETEAQLQGGIDELAPPVTDIMAFERSVMPDIIEMEMGGIRVDVAAAHGAVERLSSLIEKYQRELNVAAGFSVNVNSPNHIREIFKPESSTQGVWHVGKTLVPSTPKGNPSLGANTLRALGTPIADMILNLRSSIKTRDTFLLGHVLGFEYQGRVYPSINQSKRSDSGAMRGTGTGRLSYTDPAMQQIPSRNKEVAAIVKDVFIPDEGQTWLDCDENSFEVRIFADIVSGFDPKIIQIYKDDPDTDFHQYTADLTGLPRNASYVGQPYAKQLNLAAIFNSGNGSLADQMGMPWEWEEFETDEGELVRYRKAGAEAMEIINTYHRKLPGIRPLQQRCTEVAKDRGWLFTRHGRRLRFPDKRKAYQAIAKLIQSTAADFNKENIQIISQHCRENGGRLLLNTHDSYSISAPLEGIEDYYQELDTKLDFEGRAKVPLKMDLSGVGSTWWKALKNEHGITFQKDRG